MSDFGIKPWYERLGPADLLLCLTDIEEGVPQHTAFVSRKLTSQRQFFAAMADGKAAAEREEDGATLEPRQAKAAHLYREVEGAYARQEASLVSTIRKASTGEPTEGEGTARRTAGQWQAAAWLLERSRPAWRLRSEAIVVTPPAPVAPTDAEREADLRAYAAARGLRLVADTTDAYDPATATPHRT